MISLELSLIWTDAPESLWPLLLAPPPSACDPFSQVLGHAADATPQWTGWNQVAFHSKGGTHHTKTGSTGAQPPPLVLGAPSFLVLGRPTPSDVRDSWALVSPWPMGCDLIGRSSGRISGMRRPDEKRIPEDPPLAEPRGVTAPMFASVLCSPLGDDPVPPFPAKPLPATRSWPEMPGRGPPCSWENRGG